MAGWVKKFNSKGNPYATFQDVVDGSLITAVIQTMDSGDIHWAVDDGDHYEGVVYFSDAPPTDDHVADEKWLWNKAKLKAEDAICYIPGMPRIQWPEQYSLGAILEKARERLLERCRRTIDEFEAINPDHPLVQKVK